MVFHDSALNPNLENLRNSNLSETSHPFFNYRKYFYKTFKFTIFN